MSQIHVRHDKNARFHKAPRKVKGMRKVITACVLAATVVMASGCTDGRVPHHRGRWEDGTSPLGEGYDTPDDDSDTGKKANAKPDDENQRQTSDDGGDNDDRTENPQPQDSQTVPAIQQDGGIWVKTSVTTMLTDEDGNAMASTYDSKIDGHGNVLSTHVTSDDWIGDISYGYDENGYRTTCTLQGGSGVVRGHYYDSWVPEFETGFLGMVDDEQAGFKNATDTDGRLIRSVPVDGDSEYVVTYTYDGQGGLHKMSRADGYAEEYDSDGNIVAIIQDDEDDPDLSERVTYEYRKDATGRVTGATLYSFEGYGADSDKELAGNIAYVTDENGIIAHATVSDAEDEFGYRLEVAYGYEYVPNPSLGARLYARIDRYSMFI